MSRGIRVKDKLVEWDCEEIQFGSMKLGDKGVKEVLDALVQGKFTLMKTIVLVSCDIVVHGVVHT